MLFFILRPYILSFPTLHVAIHQHKHTWTMGAFAQAPRHSTSRRENMPSLVVPIQHNYVRRNERREASHCRAVWWKWFPRCKGLHGYAIQKWFRCHGRERFVWQVTPVLWNMKLLKFKKHALNNDTESVKHPFAGNGAEDTKKSPVSTRIFCTSKIGLSTFSYVFGRVCEREKTHP